MALLQVIGIASVFPFMQLVSEPETIADNRFLSLVYNKFNFQDAKSMLIASGIGVIVLLGIANVASIYISWLQQKFAWNVLHNIGSRLLQNYLYQPYKYFLKNNTSTLLTNITSEVALFTSGVLLPSIQFISKLLMAITISILLVVANPVITGVMFGILSLTYLLIYASRKNFLKRLGNDRVKTNRKKFKNADEALKGVKTLMIYGKREFFYDRFFDASNRNSKIPPLVNIIGIIPKYLIEIIAFAGIIGTSTKIRHNLPVIDLIQKDLKLDSTMPELSENVSYDRYKFEKEINVHQLGFQYDETSQNTLSQIDISIKKGQTVAFVGSTGSGKTTLSDIIVGLLLPKEGNISIDDNTLQKSDIRSWQNELGYVPQQVFLYDETVIKNIAFGIEEGQIDLQKIQSVAKLVNMHDFITEELPDQYNTLVGENGVRLSGGQRQRLGLARALYREPSVLILDEATSALDGITENIIIESLKNISSDLTVIIVAHRLSTVKHADKIYLLKQGKVADEGTYDNLINSSPEFRKMAELS